MLLFCSRKKKKGPHYQLAGGHVDETEFLEAAQTSNDMHTQLLLAAQKGVARELFEETGMDMREQLYRLEPAALRSEEATYKDGEIIMTCEHRKRLYFFLQVTDVDFPSGVHGINGFKSPMSEAGKELLVCGWRC
jgi:8-oxo-dGTP pyrophosphatase MutT (NUDIX family)